MRHGLETTLSLATSLRTLRRGPFRADILPDRYRRTDIFHYVVQRNGSREVLACGQERSKAAAISAAERQLELLMESEPAALTRRTGS
jgi:hypothetical protein